MLPIVPRHCPTVFFGVLLYFSKRYRRSPLTQFGETQGYVTLKTAMPTTTLVYRRNFARASMMFHIIIRYTNKTCTYVRVIWHL